MDLLLAGAVFALVLMALLITLARGRGHAEQAAAAAMLRQIAGREQQPVDVLRDLPHAHGEGGMLAALYQLNLIKRFEQSMTEAGMELPVVQMLLLILLLSAAGFGLAKLLSGDATLALLAGTACGVPPLIYIRMRRRRRLRAFALQLPAALDLIKSSLEAGHTLMRGLQAVVQEFAEPLGGEFRKVVEQGRLGMALPRALDELLRRVPEEDLRLLVVAVKVQAEVGSSLALTIGRLAEIVRTRQRLQGQIRAMTAQSRMSGFIVGFLPLAVLAIFSMIQPNYTHVLFHDPMGIKAVKAALVLDGLAFVTIRRILQFEY